MSREKVTTEHISCDIPGCLETARENVTDSDKQFQVIVINGREWDMCAECHRRAQPFIAFLSSVVGLDWRLGPKTRQWLEEQEV